jgi:hypothetical protein
MLVLVLVLVLVVPLLSVAAAVVVVVLCYHRCQLPLLLCHCPEMGPIATLQAEACSGGVGVQR